MTRRGSRAEGRTIDTATAPATASYTTDALPPADTPVMHCACGGMYRNHPASEAAHKTVYGHNPIRKPAPAPAESAPALNQEGDGWTG